MHSLAEVLYDYVPVREAMIVSVCCSDRAMMRFVRAQASCAATKIQRAWRRARKRLQPLGQLATWWRRAMQRIHRGNKEFTYSDSSIDDIPVPIPHLATTIHEVNTHGKCSDDLEERILFLVQGNISPPYLPIPRLKPKVHVMEGFVLEGTQLIEDRVDVLMPTMTQEEFLRMERAQIREHYAMHVLLSVAGIFALSWWSLLQLFVESYVLEGPKPHDCIDLLVHIASKLVNQLHPELQTNAHIIEHIRAMNRHVFNHSLHNYDHGYLRIAQYMVRRHTRVPWRTEPYPTEGFARDLRAYLEQLRARGVRRPSLTQWILFWQRYPTWVLERVVVHVMMDGFQ